MSDTKKVTVNDLEFELSFLTPQAAAVQYPDRVGALDSPNTSVYAVAKCNTSKGPFVCILPLDGRAALGERDLAKKLVTAAYDELAREWDAQGFNK
jgi:hypothetical protein